MKPLPQSTSASDIPVKTIKSQLVRDSLNSSSFGVRSFLAWNVSIALLFASISAAGLYQPEYVMTFGLQEGNTEQESFDEEMGGAVAMQLEEFVDVVEASVEQPVEEVQPALVDDVPPEPEIEPEPELVEVEPVEMVTPLTTEAVFKVETPEPILEMLPEEKKIEKKPVEKKIEKRVHRPRPEALATSTRSQNARTSNTAPVASGVPSSAVGSSGGTHGSGRGLRLGGRGAKGRFPAPPYPAFARKKNAQGSMSVAISVDDAGNVTHVRILSSTGFPDLDSYACSWIQSRWRWPAGQAKTYRQPVVFRLR